MNNREIIKGGTAIKEKFLKTLNNIGKTNGRTEVQFVASSCNRDKNIQAIKCTLLKPQGQQLHIHLSCF